MWARIQARFCSMVQVAQRSSAAADLGLRAVRTDTLGQFPRTRKRRSVTCALTCENTIIVVHVKRRLHGVLAGWVSKYQDGQKRGSLAE